MFLPSEKADDCSEFDAHIAAPFGAAGAYMTKLPSVCIWT
jgi:hypothetical protein